MAKRKAVSQKTRFEIFKRDGFACQYCGATPPAVILELDHMLAVANGGGNESDNLVTSCFNCNRGKAARDLKVIPESLAEKAERIKEAEKQLRGYYKIIDAQKQRLEQEAWAVAEIMDPGCGKSGFDRADLASITNFLKRLDRFAVEEAMEIAAGKYPSGNNRTFKYFCGICWNRIKKQDG